MPFVPAPQPCWLILIEDDWAGCGACRDRAAALAAVIAAEEAVAGAQAEGPAVIRRADGLCVQMSCQGCGEWWLDVDGTPVHYAGMVAALKDAVEHGWVGDVCPACVSSDLMP